MMRTVKVVVLITLAAILMTGCVYTNIKTPLDTDLDKTEMGTKVGEASMYSVLWLVSWGDASTAAAAKDGSISTVNHMDRQFFSVLFGMYSRTTTIAYGD